MTSGRSGRQPTGASEGASSSRASRSSYAMALQKACDTAIKNVRKNQVLANSAWAAPLSSAPSAIATMVILFKAAEKDCASAILVNELEVHAADGITKVGQLPSPYFRTNLQHCSDIGRLAFMDAQHIMASIRMTARGLVAEDGSIGYIIDLLEDPEDAKYNLKPEMDALKKTAEKCLHSAQQITAKFAYWHLVIIHLKQVALSRRSDVHQEKGQTQVEKSKAKAEEKKWVSERKDLRARIIEDKDRLEDARQDVARAMRDVDREKEKPDIIEPSFLAELERAKAMIDVPPPEKRIRGIITSIKDGIVGQSEKHRGQDEADWASYETRVKRLEDEALAKSREQRDYQRSQAQQVLNRELNKEAEMKETLAKRYEELAASKFQLREAEDNLYRTKMDLELLEAKETEITDIADILDNSIHHLGELKAQIEPLVTFFEEVVTTSISHTVEQDVEAFLRPIRNQIRDGDSPGEIEALRLSKKSKERMMSLALTIQGRFSAIADISDAYVAVSNDYIRPAISWMERLSTIQDKDAWTREKNAFVKFCEKSVGDIDGFTTKTSKDVNINAQKNIAALQKRAIEAQEEDDEEDDEDE